MKKNTLIIIIIVLILLIFFVLWRINVRKNQGQRWLRYRRPTTRTIEPTTASQLTTTPTVSQTSSVDEDLKDLDKIVGDINPQQDFADMPNADLDL